jgi:serine/threonine protein kinase
MANDAVLFSRSSCTWKLADFGFTAEGSSGNILSSRFSRGTQGYRAPELIQENPSYTRKVDIFALGCVFYEAVMGKKLFTSDWSVTNYENSWETLTFPSPRLQYADSSVFFDESIHKMLHRDWNARPGAASLALDFGTFNRRLLTYSPISGESLWPGRDSFILGHSAVQFPRKLLASSTPINPNAINSLPSSRRPKIVAIDPATRRISEHHILRTTIDTVNDNVLSSRIDRCQRCLVEDLEVFSYTCNCS